MDEVAVQAEGQTRYDGRSRGIVEGAGDGS
jgi:hypothetical protein